jgi:hypothetical protein
MSTTKSHIFVHYTPSEFISDEIPSSRAGCRMLAIIRGDIRAQREIQKTPIPVPILGSDPSERMRKWVFINDLPMIRAAPRPAIFKSLWHEGSIDEILARRSSTGYKRSGIQNVEKSENPTIIWSDDWFSRNELTGSPRISEFELPSSEACYPRFSYGAVGMSDFVHGDHGIYGQRIMYGSLLTESYLAILPRLGKLLFDTSASNLLQYLQIAPNSDIQKVVDELMRVHEWPVETFCGILGVFRGSKLWLWSKGPTQYIIHHGISPLVAGDSQAIVHDLVPGDLLTIVPAQISQRYIQKFIQSGGTPNCIATAIMNKLLGKQIYGDLIVVHIC